MNSTEEKLKEILEKIVPEDEIRNKIRETEELDFFRDLEFDSMDIMTLIVEVEDTFQVDITNDENFIEIVSSYRNLLNWLCAKVVRE